MCSKDYQGDEQQASSSNCSFKTVVHVGQNLRGISQYDSRLYHPRRVKLLGGMSTCMYVSVVLTTTHPLEPSEGAFELTHGSACIIGWQSGLLDIVTAAPLFGGCHEQDTYGLKVVFCFRHYTASHYHHYARVLTCVENRVYLVEVCQTCC